MSLKGRGRTQIDRDAMLAKVAELKEKAQRARIGAATSRIRQVSAEMRTHEVPTKKHTKLPGKVSPSWHLKSLEGVPGGGRGGASVLKMIDAPTTGTRTIDRSTKEGQNLLARLERSAQNSNTTSTVQNARARGLIR